MPKSTNKAEGDAAQTTIAPVQASTANNAELVDAPIGSEKKLVCPKSEIKNYPELLFSSRRAY